MRLGELLALGYALVAVASVGCTENREQAPRQGMAGAGGQGVGGSSGFGSFEPCTAAPALNFDAGSLPRGVLGFAAGDGLNLRHDGYVSRVAADRVDVTTPGGAYSFAWRGPALDTAFAVDDSVQVLVNTYGYGLQLSVLRSSNATAAVVDGWDWVVMNKEPGSTATLRGVPSEFPALVYRLVSCCDAGFRAPWGASTQCDYSGLEASLEGETTEVRLGGTGEIGPWSVTNVQSTYLMDGEHTWSVRVTLLGPATPKSVDGGL